MLTKHSTGRQAGTQQRDETRDWTADSQSNFGLRPTYCYDDDNNNNTIIIIIIITTTITTIITTPITITTIILLQ
jgi:hypothetical protein